MLNLSDTILTCSGYISGSPWPCLAGSKGVKSTDKGTYIVTASIKSTYAKNTCISSTCTIDTRIRYAGVGGTCTGGICTRSALVKGVKPRVLVGLGVTLADLKVNDWYFWLLKG